MAQQASQRATPLNTGSAITRHLRAAISMVVAALVATVVLLPVAIQPGPLMPGFLLFHETMLIATYAVATCMLFAQFWRNLTVALLIAAGGTLFTAAAVALQLLSTPDVFAVGPLLGAGTAIMGWAWVAWHLGPPCWGLALAVLFIRGRALVVQRRHRGSVVAAAAASALALAVAVAVVAPTLPLLTVGAEYHIMLTSGIGPALEMLALAAATILTWATRGQRSMLHVWTIVALALLALDIVLTLAGGARGSIGWTAGRAMALASASTVIWAYLYEVGVLRAHDAAAVADLAAAEVQLRTAQKMEAVGQLTAAIAHDFNNLLMVVTAGFDTIRRNPEDRARVLRMAEAGLQAAERGARLTGQLLSFARRQSLRPEVANPNTLLIEFERLTGTRRRGNSAAQLRAGRVRPPRADGHRRVRSRGAQPRRQRP